MKAFLFPGQGAQRIGMGEGLFEAFPEQTACADSVLCYSIRELCLTGPMERLTQTQFTQPALYVVGALTWLKRVADGAKADYLLGHSVAEYVALFAAGVVDFETGLRLVQKRGALMAEATGGGMAAVLGLEAAQVEDIIRRHGLTDIFAANVNTPKQIVVSGKREAVVAAEPLFLEAGASHYRVLQVSGAFHTPFMQPARDAFTRFLADIEFRAPQVPVISNVTARPHRPDAIARLMAEQITAPVRWSDSIRYLLAKGLAFEDFEELGPAGGAVVKPMVKRTQLEAGPLDAAELAEEERAAEAAKARPVQEAPAMEAPVQMNGTRHKAAGFGAATLGSASFREDFGVKYAYAAGAMYQGIASADLVIRMAKAGLLAFFGAGGLPMLAVEQAIQRIRSEIPPGAPFGMNFIAHANFPQLEEDLADLLLRHEVRVIEASAFMEVTPALVRYRARGLSRVGGKVRAANRIIAKISRPDVAAQFLSPAPERLLTRLLESGGITPDEAALLREVPMADALCVESDSGGHTDQGMPFTLIPATLKVRDAAQARFPGFGRLHVGAGGGIGTPEAAAAVFVLGADFIVTGSVNQCTVEAGTSDAVKDMLEGMNVYDTDYAPSGEMFEMGSKVQVLKKGLFFPARANKLVSLYRQHESLEEIEPSLRRQIEERYFKRSFEEVFADVKASYRAAEVERAERQPKHRMALVFKRYFRDTTRWALAGDLEHKVDFQVHCGPALGAFNQWVAGSELASWRNRHPDIIADRLMDETASLLSRRFSILLGEGGS
ncbi:ACP S-malonyltransferase [Oceanibaculum indicum]|uniref:[acyl-carrier-protein] S-malonyltransferase n=1 Tax=Oceanibaculum indicum TaxID=526216 RepID=A0A420WGE5_9PROT|nr:ACP S-malonyltransferase [Oceanibaculum indicum]RKQ70070.1 trans-AT polyketide synthase/acyltransferase/oxidoreductase domain-containing protein [Oceanibaculum indicum]